MNNQADIIVYSKDELQSKGSKDIIALMRQYSLKYSGLNKSQHISAILKYQQYVEDLKETLVENNSIENYHRGHVEYSLPAMIINRIIHLLWRLEIENAENTIDENQFHFHLNAAYRKLLSLSLISKELFNLVSSSLFTKIRLYTKMTEPNHFNKSIVNPHSVMKSISHLEVDYKTFASLINDSAVNLTLKFGNLVSLTINGSDDKVGIKHCKTINSCIPKLERFILIGIIIDDPKILNLIKEFPSLTSLDISRSSFKDTEFSFGQLSDNITSIKLPSILAYDQTSTQNKVTCNLKSIQIPVRYVTPKILTDNLTTLNLIDQRILKSTLEGIPQSLKDFLISDNCKIKNLGLRCQVRFKNEFIQIMKQTVANSKSIETLDLHSDLSFSPKNGWMGSLMFTLTVPMSNIKSLNIYGVSKFFNDLKQFCKDNGETQPSGFTIYRSKPMPSNYLFNKYRKYYLKRSGNNNIQNDDNEIVNYHPMNDI